MNSFASDSKYWQRWIVFAIVCSLCIHAFLFFGMQHLSIHLSVVQQQRRIERVNSMQVAAIAGQTKKEEAIIRTQELAKIFHSLTLKPTEEPEPAAFDLQREVISLAESETGPSLELPVEIMGADNSDPTEFGVLTPNIEALVSEMPLTEIRSFKLDYQAFGEELIETTKPMFGAIVAEEAEPLTSSDSLTIGGLETTPFQGNSFKEQAGVIGRNLHDFSELEVSGRQLLMSTIDMKNLKTVLLKNTNGQMHASAFPQFDNEFFLPGVLRARTPVLDSPIGDNTAFSFKIEYAPKRDLTGYLFKLELTPKADYAYKRIPQNYFFLIDRSPSIGRQRYEHTKTAVSQALGMLRADDFFNILVFDGQITRFSARGVPCSPQNIALAQGFLDTQKFSNFFGSTNLGSSLSHIVSMEAKENAVNSAILLSDGDILLSISKQRKTVSQWTAENQGRIALYSLAAGRGNNLPLLELLSVFNRGMLFHAPSDQAIEPTLAMLLHGLQNPIAREMVATATLRDGSHGHIRLLPATQRLPHLYQHIPYVLYGSVDQLEDFHLFLQGENHENILSVKEQISFESGTQVDIQMLERAWAIQQAHEHYAHYLHDGQPRHLKAIKVLLAPYRISME